MRCWTTREWRGDEWTTGEIEQVEMLKKAERRAEATFIGFFPLTK